MKKFNDLKIKDDSFFMRRALILAEKSALKNEVPIAAIIVQENIGIIASAHNLRETKNIATAHAELLVINKACKKLNRWRLYDCTLYVTLEPCFMCAGAIILARIPRVVFAAKDPKAGAVGSLCNILQDSRLNHSCYVHEGLHAEQASKLLKDFFKQRRKQND